MDVLRGSAVALVLLRHAWPSVFPGAGITGVVVFFVLSGYLITGVLHKDISNYGKIRYGRFYAHRAFRLLPALLAMLAVYAAAELVADVLGDRTSGVIGNTLFVALLYLRDLPLPIPSSVAIGPLWTLALEEQFYLIWPALLVFASRRNALGRLITYSGLLVFFSMIASVLIVGAVNSRLLIHLYSFPTTWAVALIAGSALFLYRARVSRLLANRCFFLTFIAGAFLTLVGVIAFAEVKESSLFYLLGGPALIIASCIVVAVAATQRSPSPKWAAPLRQLGKISYGAYLWNYLIVQWLKADSDGELSLLAALASIGLTVLAALLSWYTVEAFGRWLRFRFDAKHQNLLTEYR